jgi:PAS domain S-box-containing protein
MDLNKSLGTAGWVWYCVPLFLSFFAGGGSSSFLLAAVFSVLTMAGFFLSPPGVDHGLDLVSRVMGIFVFWVMAFLIWQHERAAMSLRESEERYRNLVENARDAIFTISSEGRITSTNSACESLVGWKRDELIGQPFAPLVHPDDQTLAQDIFQRTLAGEKMTICQLRVRTRSGQPAVLEFLGTQQVENGRVIGALGVARDITGRKQAEDVLRQSREEFKGLFDNAPVGFHEVDAEGRLVRINDTELKMLGYTAGELVGQFVWKISAEEETSRRAALAKLGGEPPPAHGFERMFRRKDGSTFPVLIKDRLLKREDGVVIGIRAAVQDITERRQVEAELNRERELWQTLLDKSPDKIYFKDTKSRFIKASKSQARQFGLESPDAMVGKTDFDFFDEAHARPAFEDEQKIISTGEPMIDKEEREVWRDGRVTWASSTKLPWFDGAGKIIGIMGVSRDITRRKQAEEQLRQLSSAVEHSPASIVITDRDGNIEYINPKFTEVTGYSSGEVIGKNPRILKSGEMSAEEYQRMWRTIISGAVWRGEFHNRRKNGELFWEAASISSILDDSGKIAHFVAVKEDITEHKRAEERLTEAFNFNRAIIEDAAVGITVFKMSGQCVLVNEAAAKILGGAVSRLLEQDFRQISSWQTSGMLQVAEEVLATKTPRRRESHFTTSFGREVWLESHFSHFIQNGEPHLLHVFSDVTEKKKLESQFLRAQRMESIGTLAGGIAHDLNNVLTPLLFSVHVLREKISDDEGQQMLDILESNVRRGAGLVKQVLEFGRGVKGDRILLQVKSIAREIEQIVRETFPKSVQFRLESAPDIWTVSCDPTQIHQVLLNLCVNARDAMPTGGKLSLRLNNVMLDAASAAVNLDARPGRYVVISVEDTGVGIPLENQERIFEPFFTTKELGKGTGLGLSTTLAIVKSHGGFIHCYSTPGKGSIFKVYLPADASSATVDNAPVDTQTMPRGHNELVLVADDEEPIRKFAKNMLERFGYRVLVAANGVEAVNLYTARQNEIAVVITDMAMPVMDGHATIAALQAINPKVKVIGSSGLDMNDGTTKAVDTAIRHFIPKPYTVESLLKILDDVLREKSSG